ncbi:hypothetical protein FOZ60_010830 [Perkinsus olseni]|uniref:Uncharacterized protein n=1 Tax=Perkinsus olseni TaxID=32597 RepID=A0A7J6NFJ8_PEROL|nr:hypothetical protein FOZ60_010830 [Perkinsus olseni]
MVRGTGHSRFPRAYGVTRTRGIFRGDLDDGSLFPDFLEALAISARSLEVLADFDFLGVWSASVSPSSTPSSSSLSSSSATGASEEPRRRDVFFLLSSASPFSAAALSAAAFISGGLVSGGLVSGGLCQRRPCQRLLYLPRPSQKRECRQVS